MKKYNTKNTTVDKNFDGHPEKPLKDMTPEEKLDYIWSQMELRRFIKTRAVKKARNK